MAAARMARWRGNADRRRGECGVFIGPARLLGDGTRPEMRPWYPASTGVRTAGRRRRIGGPWLALGRYGADKRWCTAREVSKEPHGVGAWGRRGLGWWAASAGVAARGSGRNEFVLLIPWLSMNNSKFLNRNVPTDEYESCRSSYPLPLSKSLYSVLLNRFCRKGLPTLNATQLP
jgi:hypothetical protein